MGILGVFIPYDDINVVQVGKDPGCGIASHEIVMEEMKGFVQALKQSAAKGHPMGTPFLGVMSVSVPSSWKQ